jgi:hypothetical protein
MPPEGCMSHSGVGAYLRRNFWDILLGQTPSLLDHLVLFYYSASLSPERHGPKNLLGD